jgi:hypothetical protein
LDSVGIVNLVQAHREQTRLPEISSVPLESEGPESPGARGRSFFQESQLFEVAKTAEGDLGPRGGGGLELPFLSKPSAGEGPAGTLEPPEALLGKRLGVPRRRQEEKKEAQNPGG